MLEQEIANNRLAINQEEKNCEEAKAELDRIISDIQSFRDSCHDLLQNIESLKGEIGIFNEKIQQATREKKRLEEELAQGKLQVEQDKKERRQRVCPSR